MPDLREIHNNINHKHWHHASHDQFEMNNLEGSDGHPVVSDYKPNSLYLLFDYYLFLKMYTSDLNLSANTY